MSSVTFQRSKFNFSFICLNRGAIFLLKQSFLNKFRLTFLSFFSLVPSFFVHLSLSHPDYFLAGLRSKMFEQKVLQTSQLIGLVFSFFAHVFVYSIGKTLMLYYVQTIVNLGD